MGSIASGKSSLINKLVFPHNAKIEYLCSDNLKREYFDKKDKKLKKSYRCADELLFFRLEELCSKSENIVLEFCPTNRNKFETIKFYSRKYKYRIVSFFVGTDNVSINISRGEKRELSGYDHVSYDKIKSRYEDAFSSILEICCISDVVYFIDNSTDTYRLVAKMNNGTFKCFTGDCDWFNDRVRMKLNNQRG